MNEANETIDEGVRATLRSTNDATKEAILFELLDEIITNMSEEPRLPALAAARTFREELVKFGNNEGWPPPTPEEIEQAERYRASPSWSEEEEARIERLIETLDDSSSVQEVRGRLLSRIPVQTP